MEQKSWIKWFFREVHTLAEINGIEIVIFENLRSSSAVYLMDRIGFALYLKISLRCGCKVIKTVLH
jgi:hypothetical protein